MKSNSELISILEESENSLENAIQQLDGSGLDCEVNVLCLMEALADVKKEKARYESRAEHEEQANLEALRMEYERSVV